MSEKAVQKKFPVIWRNPAIKKEYSKKTKFSLSQVTAKRGFDFLAATMGLLLTFWLITLLWVGATIDTRANGFFVQERVGRFGRRFHVIKLRTMRADSPVPTMVTISGDVRITCFGRFLRRLKLDELPQLINVFKGDMSLVGPRPDVPGYADLLKGEDRIVLNVRPGITGPAALKYKNEEALLARQDDAERYNNEVIWPDKVRLNRDYVKNWSFRKDLYYIWRTIFG